MKIILLVLRLLAAGILLQTLFFKFTGAPESIYIFSTLGMEPWGRWLSGFSELIAAILILIPSTQGIGAVMAVAIMLGAVLSHLLVLGFVVQEDGGLLFSLACTVLISSSLITFFRRRQIFQLIQRYANLLPSRNRKTQS